MTIKKLLELAEKQLDQNATHDGLTNCDVIAKARAELNGLLKTEERLEGVVHSLTRALNAVTNPHRLGFWLEGFGGCPWLNSDQGPLKAADLSGEDAIWAYVGAILHSKETDNDG